MEGWGEPASGEDPPTTRRRHYYFCPPEQQAGGGAGQTPPLSPSALLAYRSLCEAVSFAVEESMRSEHLEDLNKQHIDKLFRHLLLKDPAVGWQTMPLSLARFCPTGNQLRPLVEKNAKAILTEFMLRYIFLNTFTCIFVDNPDAAAALAGDFCCNKALPPAAAVARALTQSIDFSKCSVEQYAIASSAVDKARSSLEERLGLFRQQRHG